MPDEAAGGAGRPRKKSPSATDCEFQIVKVEDIRKVFETRMKMTISKLFLNFLIFLSFFTFFLYLHYA